MDKATQRSVRALIAPLARQAAMSIARAVVRLVDDSKGRQTLQAEILEGELRDGVERAQNYGFTSHPLGDADAVIVCAGGQREQAIAIVVDDRRYRISLQAGEVAMYDDLGNKIQLLRNMVRVDAVQHLEASAPTTRIMSAVTIEGSLNVQGPSTMNGNVNIVGDVDTTGGLTNNGKNVGSTHMHINSGGTGIGGPPQ